MSSPQSTYERRLGSLESLSTKTMTAQKRSLCQSHLRLPSISHSGPELGLPTAALKFLHYPRYLLSSLLGAVLLMAPGCSLLPTEIIQSPCKTRAFTLESKESARDNTLANQQDSRLGIFAFDVPANLAAAIPDRGDSGVYLAARVQQQLMGGRLIGIVEVVPLYDWPGKREEFLRGNFGALTLGKDAGYDLVLVGAVQPQRRSNELSALIKVIDIRNHVTLEYFESSFTEIPTTSMLPNRLRPEEMPPDTTHSLLDGLSSCIADHLKGSEAQEAGLPNY